MELDIFNFFIKEAITYEQWWDSNFLRTGSLTPGLTNN